MHSTSCCPPCPGTASRASRSRSVGTWAGPHGPGPSSSASLGYGRYVAQGGDVGAGIADTMGRQAPEGLIGIHTNLLVPALNGPMPTETDEERAAATQLATFRKSGNGYFVEMATRPQTIGYALLDSP